MRPIRALRLIVILGVGFATACSAPTGVLDFCDGADDDGDGMIDEGSGELVGCAPREVCVAGTCSTVCGDAFCDVENLESCSSCPGDCGACPRCGDGTCNATESCSSCAGDCGACPRCGDGTCNTGETCTSCRDDCGLCPGECRACGEGFTCGAGLECGSRYCDGAEACYRTAADAACAEVDGDECPAVNAYAPCTDAAQCGPRMSCYEGHCTPVVRSGSGPSACDEPGFCPPAPAAPAGLTVQCNNGDTGLRCCAYHCVLRCTGACPYGMTCVSGICS